MTSKKFTSKMSTLLIFLRIQRRGRIYYRDEGLPSRSEAARAVDSARGEVLDACQDDLRYPVDMEPPLRSSVKTPLQAGLRVQIGRPGARRAKVVPLHLDPTDLYTAPPRSFRPPFPYGLWKVKPFYSKPPEEWIADLIALVNSNAPATSIRDSEFRAAGCCFLQDPFNPFAITRLRTTAFQKATVIDYLDNLSPGAIPFRQNTREETINEATKSTFWRTNCLARVRSKCRATIPRPWLQGSSPR